MTGTRLHAALRHVAVDLAESGANCALVGGLAVSARTEPRFTRDLDLAVRDDEEAQALVRFLRTRRYVVDVLVEQEASGRIATVRLIPPAESALRVDLLFASSGIEPEIVAAAEPIEIIEGLIVRVATVPHLIATKVLSRDDAVRPQDHMDLVALLKAARGDDLREAREALRLIETRGYHRGKDLLSDLEKLNVCLSQRSIVSFYELNRTGACRAAACCFLARISQCGHFSWSR